MKKRILITAGTVYGRLDDNKLVGNRVRGIWAARFARWLFYRGHQVTLLVADTQREAIAEHMSDGPIPPDHEWATVPGSLDVLTHKGFHDYQDQCLKLATEHDAAVMAAAVVNWIPKRPVAGKMSTTSLRELKHSLGMALTAAPDSADVPIPGFTTVNIPFILAPRVIDAMRDENTNLTLIGCKMTIDASRDELIDAAYKTLVGAKCHAVIANDMSKLRTKTVLYPDRAQFDFDVGTDDGVSFYKQLEAIMLDEHFSTLGMHPSSDDLTWSTLYGRRDDYTSHAPQLFDKICDKYRTRFVHKIAGTDRVFGAVAVRVAEGALCSPREKGAMFGSKDAVRVAIPTTQDLKLRRVRVFETGCLQLYKATMNATLLLRVLASHASASAVLHLHEQLPGVPTLPYAPPGTVRDNMREEVVHMPAFNIEGHGCIVALDHRGEMHGKWES